MGMIEASTSTIQSMMTRQPRQQRGRAGRAAAIRRDAEITASARARRPEATAEEQRSSKLKQAISSAFERA